MFRVLLASIVLVSIGISASPAQIFNPNVNPVPAPPPPPTPSIAIPHLEAVPPVIGTDSASPAPRAPQLTPGGPARPSFSDRAVACAHQGAAIGVPPGSIGQYTRECANSQ